MKISSIPVCKEHEYYITQVRNATCTTPGYLTLYCKVCADSQTVTLAKLGHDMQKETVAPTCTAKGFTQVGCTRCSYHENRVYYDAIGHSYVTVSYTAAKCGVNGSRVKCCNNCNQTIIETIAAPSHDWFLSSLKAATCTANGKEVYKCNNCNRTRTVTLKALGHSQKTVTKKATCWEDGYTEVVCSNKGCNKVFSHTVILSHTAHTWKHILGNLYKCTKCGIQKN